MMLRAQELKRSPTEKNPAVESPGRANIDVDCPHQMEGRVARRRSRSQIETHERPS